MNITLRIKKKYFDLILEGSKFIEYRDVKKFYIKLFKQKDEIKTLTLHYQSERILICDVLAIRKITMEMAQIISPDEFSDTDISFGSHVFAIFIKNARLIKK